MKPVTSGFLGFYRTLIMSVTVYVANGIISRLLAGTVAIRMSSPPLATAVMMRCRWYGGLLGSAADNIKALSRYHR